MNRQPSSSFTKHFQISAVLAWSLWALPSQAHEFNTERVGAKEYLACIGDSGNTHILSTCGEDYVRAADAKLAKVFARTKLGWSEYTEKDLEQEQAQWREYLDASCDYFTRRLDFGSDGVAVRYSSCKIAVIQNRIDELRNRFNFAGE